MGNLEGETIFFAKFSKFNEVLNIIQRKQHFILMCSTYGNFVTSSFTLPYKMIAIKQICQRLFLPIPFLNNLISQHTPF